jgi:hypothetical protein
MTQRNRVAILRSISKELEPSEFFRPATDYVCFIEAIAKTLPVSEEPDRQ